MRITRSRIFTLKQLSKKSLVVATTSLLALTALFAASAIFQPAHDAHAAATPESCFEFDSATGTITDYYDNEANDPANPTCPRDVEIPSTIGGVGVTAIGNDAFAYNQLTTLTIPNSVTTIGVDAFAYNQLTTLTIPNSVTTIGEYAFAYNQLTTVTIPNSVTTVGDSTFFYNPITNFTVDDVTYTPAAPTPQACFDFDNASGTIADYKFSTVSSLRSGEPACLAEVDIPSSLGGVPVSSIGGGAFAYNQLTTLTIPNSVTTIGEYAFYYNQLTTVTMSDNVTSLDASVFINQSTLATFREDLYSPDPIKMQAAFDSIFYTSVYTSNPANPANLSSQVYIVDEAIRQDYDCDPAGPCPNDLNGDGDTLDTFNFGGHLINPASTTLAYKDASGNTLRPSETQVGKRSDGTVLASYLAKDTPLTIDQVNGSTADTTVYHRAGTTTTFTPPAIPGYTTPAPQATTLAAGDNTITFVYQPTSTSAPITSVPFNQHAVESGTLTSSTTPPSISSPLITTSSLAITNQDGSAPTDCHTIQSAKLLAPNTISSPDTRVTLLGGLNFSLACTTGAHTNVTYTLGATVSDTTKLRIYKHNTKTNTTEDITHHMTITRTDNKTLITYTLTDGGSMDEDGLVNGIIVDPIYVGLENSAEELARTGENIFVIVLFGALGVMMASGMAYRLRRTRS